MSLRIVFMGTPDFSVPTLAAIIAAGHRVVAVYAQPPRPAGRGMAERKSPVHAYADAAGLLMLTPRTLRTPETQAEFAAHAADVAVVVAYGLILPKPILDAPRHGCLNLHASALPRWRGAAPIQRAIMAGDATTAAIVMRMEEGLDTGPICLAETIAIGPDTTAGGLHDILAQSGATLMVRALAELQRGQLASTPQSSEGVTYARKIDKAESHVDFAQPARVVHDHIRSLSPFPGAWFAVEVDGKEERIKVLRSAISDVPPSGRQTGEIIDDQLIVACADGAVRLIELQRAGRRPMTSAELQRGFPLAPGTRLR